MGSSNNNPQTVTGQTQLDYSAFAILLRNFRFGKYGHMTAPFERALTKRKIPYRIVGGTPFFDKPCALDLRAYLTLFLSRGECNSAFLRVVNEPPRGLGEQFLIYLKAEQRGRNQKSVDKQTPVSLWRTAESLLVEAESSEFMTPAYRRGLEAFVSVVREGADKLQLERSPNGVESV